MDPMVVIQIILGILVAISIGLCGWALSSVVSLKSDLSAETARNNQRDIENDRRHRESREWHNQQLAQAQQLQAAQYVELQKSDARIESSVVAMHKRFDHFLDTQAKGG